MPTQRGLISKHGGIWRVAQHHSSGILSMRRRRIKHVAANISKRSGGGSEQYGAAWHESSVAKQRRCGAEIEE